MLTETFVVATANPDKPTNNTAAGIHFHDFQPLSALKTTFKKSSAKPNCLAIGPTHVFAAQADKAVIHVYSRERNNQEIVVPFPERIQSIALAAEQDGAGILIVGTEGGRLILWELGTGRQVSTPQHHLQPVTCLAVDLTSNFVLSGSIDSNIHVWSLPSLLSFSASYHNEGLDLRLPPLRTLSRHRAAVTSVVLGHSTSKHNIAVSSSKDDTCVVWDYQTGNVLRTFLLQSTPLCLALDPIDRAVYVGHGDGSIHLIDLYKLASNTQHLHDNTLQAAPTQPPTSDQWMISKDLSSQINSLQVSYDGTIVLSGHENGKVHTWNVARGSYKQQIADFAAPVTNLVVLSPSDFPKTKRTHLKLHHVVKPRYDEVADGSYARAGLPQNYTFTVQFATNIPLSDSEHTDLFHESLEDASFPTSLLDKAFVDFASQGPNPNKDSTAIADLQAQNLTFSTQLKETQDTLRERDREDWKRRQDTEIKAAQKKKRRLRQIQIDEVKRKKEMGEVIDEVIEEESFELAEKEELQGLSSDTNEITDSG